MNLDKIIRSIAMVAALGVPFSDPAQASAHWDAPLLPFDSVDFEGSGPVFDAGGKLVAVERIRFSGVSADGHVVEASGELSLRGQGPGNGDLAETGIIDDILGRVGHLGDATGDAFTGSARVSFESISVDQQRVAASGSLRLQITILEPVPVREFTIEAVAVPGDDGGFSARFHGEDRLGLGLSIDGLWVSPTAWSDLDNGDDAPLRGHVEALAWRDSGADPNAFEDKIGSEEIYFAYYGPGATKGEAAYWRMASLQSPPFSATDDGRFTATLVLPFTDNSRNHQHGPLNLQVDEVIVSRSQRESGGRVTGRAEVLFSGVGSRDDVEVTVSGTAEFNFLGESADGHDWFMGRGDFRILSGTLGDAATGGAALFQDISGSLGQARIVGRINPARQVDLAGGLGQVTLER